MIERINQEHQRNLSGMERRLRDRISQKNKLMEDDMKDQKEREERIEKRLEQRDENLMKVIREIQETKRIIEEVAAAQTKKKTWWKFFG